MNLALTTTGETWFIRDLYRKNLDNDTIIFDLNNCTWSHSPRIPEEFCQQI